MCACMLEQRKGEKAGSIQYFDFIKFMQLQS